MNRSEIAQLLTVVASFDRRTLGEADVIAWHGALGDLTLPECSAAVVKHYAEATDWVMPAHVRKRALAGRQDAAMRSLPAGTDDMVLKPDWFDGLAAEHKQRTREENRQRKERGDRPVFGKTVLAPSDGRPGW